MLKFLQFYLGEHYFLSEDDQFGSYLFAQMRRPRRDARRDHVLEGYAGQWRVYYGAVPAKKLGLRLTGKVVQKFNKWVDGVMKTEMVGYINCEVKHGNKIKYAIEEYLTEHGMSEEDVQVETLYKHYQRKSNKRKAKKKEGVVRPGRPEAELRKDLRRLPLPVPAVPSVVARPVA
ncbi:hypothetical protein Q5H93_14805 [Hymenobacter sp. ASUV-10]|uniref:Uncharacterized protein n=1 Tax=Hymenobacter aranciens TaxID=3063996 RepID=A0ABT9BH78_9BACT|nr:hypothetical protein [Hymenobacter sp. ASUV-10]MDO7876011.1 hypothetical protein [Hymenobacter sp. ASUV-10]